MNGTDITEASRVITPVSKTDLSNHTAKPWQPPITTLHHGPVHSIQAQRVPLKVTVYKDFCLGSTLVIL